MTERCVFRLEWIVILCSQFFWFSEGFSAFNFVEQCSPDGCFFLSFSSPKGDQNHSIVVYQKMNSNLKRVCDKKLCSPFFSAWPKVSQLKVINFVNDTNFIFKNRPNRNSVQPLPGQHARMNVGMQLEKRTNETFKIIKKKRTTRTTVNKSALYMAIAR